MLALGGIHLLNSAAVHVTVFIRLRAQPRPLGTGLPRP
jgi:hypothetical protein